MYPAVPRCAALYPTSVTLLLEPRPLLDKADEGGDASAWADHHHRAAGFEGQPELRLPDIHGHGGLVPVVHHHFVLQPVGGDSPVDPTRLGLVLQHHGADVNTVGKHLTRTMARSPMLTSNGLHLILHLYSPLSYSLNSQCETTFITICM